MKQNCIILPAVSLIMTNTVFAVSEPAKTGEDGKLIRQDNYPKSKDNNQIQSLRAGNKSCHIEFTQSEVNDLSVKRIANSKGS